MKQITFYISTIIILMISCTDHKDNETENDIPTEKYQSIKDDVFVFDSLPSVDIVYKDSILVWKEYFNVKEQLSYFKKTSPNDVLGMSENLVKEIAFMRDSIRVEILNVKGMRARMNTLYNQALRLQEMKDITAITVPEIKKQTTGLFVLFRMMNTKINAIYEQNQFEKDLLEDEFFFSKLDSIK